MRRRQALYALMSAFALPITPHADKAAALLDPSTGAANTDATLGQLAGYVWRLGVEHMHPTSNPHDVQAGALAAWRDLHEVHKRLDTAQRTVPLRCDALMSASRAAALVAEVYSDDADQISAHAWYNRARSDADHAAEIASRAGDRHTHGQAIGVGATVVAMYSKKLLPFNPQQAIREVLATWQRLQVEDVPRCTAHAMVPAVLARGRAITGDARGASSTLRQAEQFLELEDYPDCDPDEVSILRYHPRSHYYSSADVFSLIGSVSASRDCARAYAQSSGPQPRMNAAVIALAESTCRLTVDGADASAEHAARVLAELPADNRTPTVLGRVDQLTRRLEHQTTARNGRPPARVRDLRQAIDDARRTAAPPGGRTADGTFRGTPGGAAAV